MQDKPGAGVLASRL